MTQRSFAIEVSHYQLAVFDSSLDNPFNPWTDEDVAQGFAWRPGSVSFETEDGGRHRVEVVVAEDVEISPRANRIIEVPFVVRPDVSVEVASIADSVLISVPAGTYQLRFEYIALAPPLEPTVKLVFAKSDNPTFQVIRIEPADRPRH